MPKNIPKKPTAKDVVKPKATKPDGNESRLYSLEVFILSGPITKQFAKRNKGISRTIQIRGSQTLEDLHYAIFDAFDRYDEHMYEFQFGKGPNDPKGKRYVHGEWDEDFGCEPNVAGDLTETTIGSLGLKLDQAFGYWFDFGDDWWHQINVVAIDDRTPRGKYPKAVKRVGESPPQYPDRDDEE